MGGAGQCYCMTQRERRQACKKGPDKTNSRRRRGRLVGSYPTVLINNNTAKGLRLLLLLSLSPPQQRPKPLESLQIDKAGE